MVCLAPDVPLCFYVIPAFLPSLLGTLRHADLRIKLSPGSPALLYATV